MTKSRDIADSINRIDSSAADATAMTIDANENVGIGTSSPLAAGSSYTVVDIGSASTASLLNMTDNGTETGRIVAQDDQLHLSSGTASGFIGFRTGGFSSGSERMRIDSSGNLLVGKTATGTTTAGSQLNADGLLTATRDGNYASILTRLNSDGDILLFRKDSTTVGSIGVGNSNDLTIGTADTGLVFQDNERISPWNPSTNSLRDAAIDFGDSDRRFKDLYLSGSVYLGGTGSANALDDYEEGTFTVTLLTTGSPNPTYTITNNTGYYTKVGRLVTANFYSGAINITNAGSGAARISGLPFNANTAAYGQYSVVSFTHTTAFTSNAEGGITLGGSTQIAVYAEGTTSSMAFTTGSSLYMMFTVTYWTD